MVIFSISTTHFVFGYNTVWTANTVYAMDPNNSVIKRLWCIDNLSSGELSQRAIKVKAQMLHGPGDVSKTMVVEWQFLAKECAQYWLTA